MGKLLHEDLTYQIIGAAMDVHRELGPGWGEIDYHMSMVHALEVRGLKVESHLRDTLLLHGTVVDHFELDILVEGIVVLELKHCRTGFAQSHYAQIINYLKFWRCDLGLLINFGMERLHFKRVPYTACAGELEIAGAWDDGLVSSVGRKNVLDACQLMLREIGLGYGEQVVRKLMKEALLISGAKIETPIVQLSYDNLDLGAREVEALMLNNNFLVLVTGLYENTSAVDFARLFTYMKKLNINHGALINYGRSTLMVRGVNMKKLSDIH
jgi:GxxExxY protein